MTQTKGQYRVGVDFNPSGNPSGNPLVAEIKDAAAALIDAIERVPVVPPNPSMDPITPAENQQIMERKRLKAHAQTLVEDGCRAAVAAATKPLPG